MGERIMAGYYDRDRPAAAGQMNHAQSHYGNTAEYMVSGYPWIKSITASGAQTITFDFVTQWICISAIGANVTLTFGGAQTFIVPVGTISPRFNVKCKTITVTLGSTGGGESANIAAGLTNVPAADFPDITGYTGIA
jgi:hypothetical protein